MHRMHRIFSGGGWLVVLDIRIASGQAFAFESRFAEMDEPSHRHASHVTGASPKGAVRLSEKSPARHSPTTPSGRPTRERGRPARILSRCVPLSFPAMRHPATLPAGTAWARPKQSPGAVAGRPGWRRETRLYQDLCGRDARAPGWASSHDAVASEEVHGYLCLFLVPLQQPSAVSSSDDPLTWAGAGPFF